MDVSKLGLSSVPSFFYLVPSTYKEATSSHYTLSQINLSQYSIQEYTTWVMYHENSAENNMADSLEHYFFTHRELA